MKPLLVNVTRGIWGNKTANGHHIITVFGCESLQILAGWLAILRCSGITVCPPSLIPRIGPILENSRVLNDQKHAHRRLTFGRDRAMLTRVFGSIPLSNSIHSTPIKNLTNTWQSPVWDFVHIFGMNGYKSTRGLLKLGWTLKCTLNDYTSHTSDDGVSEPTPSLASQTIRWNLDKLSSCPQFDIRSNRGKFVVSPTSFGVISGEAYPLSLHMTSEIL